MLNRTEHVVVINIYYSNEDHQSRFHGTQIRSVRSSSSSTCLVLTLIRAVVISDVATSLQPVVAGLQSVVTAAVRLAF